MVLGSYYFYPMHKPLLLILLAAIALVSCNRNRRHITPNCYLQKEPTGYSLVMDAEFVQDTITHVTQVGWKGDWVYAWGRDTPTGREGWVHIWDNVVLKHYGPIAEDQSYYGRKDAVIYTAEAAWQKLE